MAILRGGASNIKINRRQFLKVSLGTIGTTVASEAVGPGLNTSAAQEQPLKIPIKMEKQCCPHALNE